tara:strand:- start:254 stop:472 length:219 start_codon:yes stop_codon:yes gene_type:complete
MLKNPGHFSFSFSAVFVGHSVMSMASLAHNKRSCYKNGNLQAKIENSVFLFFQRKKCHAVLDFREQQAIQPD